MSEVLAEEAEKARELCRKPARGPWTNLGRLPLRVFSIGKYAFQRAVSEAHGGSRPDLMPEVRRAQAGKSARCPMSLRLTRVCISVLL